MIYAGKFHSHYLKFYYHGLIKRSPKGFVFVFVFQSFQKAHLKYKVSRKNQAIFVLKGKT